MNILHVIPYLGKAQGGPVESLRLLASAQAELGHKVRVVHTGVREDGELARFPTNVAMIHAKSYGPRRWSPIFIKHACTTNFLPDIVHSHGLWFDVSRRAGKLVKKLGVPHIVSPCGMLHHDALQRFKWKKRIAWCGFQKNILLSATIIHAKSEAEALSVREILPRVNTEVIPNPIETPPDHVLNGQSENKNGLKTQLFSKYDVSPEQRILLFLGRVHAVKGLERLISAWLSIFEEFPDWVLIIVGPDEDGHLQKLKSMVTETIPPRRSIEKINDTKPSVVFAAPIFGDQRWKAYASADLFVAPSSFENFGQSIAEALCAGVPVITTTTTPWKGLKENGCGWFIDPSIDSIASALKEAMSLKDSERTAKGRIGKQLVRQYSPHGIAEQMCSLYASLMCSNSQKTGMLC